MNENASMPLDMELSEDQKRLQPILTLVANPKDWKAPIGPVTIPKEMRDIVAEAIQFYTATPAVFEEIGDGQLSVTARGYRLGPAGDH